MHYGAEDLLLQLKEAMSRNERAAFLAALQAADGEEEDEDDE